MHPDVTGAKEIIQKYLTEEYLEEPLPSIQAIAEELGLSESTLKREFRAKYKNSIYDYYLKLKMNLAKEKLKKRHIPINKIAQGLGYEKTSNFITMFNKHHGMTPGVFRKKNPKKKKN